MLAGAPRDAVFGWAWIEALGFKLLVIDISAIPTRTRKAHPKPPNPDQHLDAPAPIAPTWLCRQFEAADLPK